MKLKLSSSKEGQITIFKKNLIQTLDLSLGLFLTFLQRTWNIVHKPVNLVMNVSGALSVQMSMLFARISCKVDQTESIV